MNPLNPLTNEKAGIELCELLGLNHEITESITIIADVEKPQIEIVVDPFQEITHQLGSGESLCLHLGIDPMRTYKITITLSPYEVLARMSIEQYLPDTLEFTPTLLFHDIGEGK